MKRVLDRGRRMRVHVGDVGPIPGVQGFECTGTLNIERRNEYDSDQQIITTGQAEYAGNLEVLDCERDTVWKAMMGKKPSDAAVSDVLVENLQSLPIMLNVWNVQKTKFIKGYVAMGVTYTDLPYPTTVDGLVTMRFAFNAVQGIKFPNHAVGFTVLSVGGSPTLGPYALGRTAVQLSRKFQNSYIMAAVNRTPDAGSQTSEYLIKYLCADATLTTSTNAYLQDLPDPNSQVILYYAYTSTNEAGGYICQTS